MLSAPAPAWDIHARVALVVFLRLTIPGSAVAAVHRLTAQQMKYHTVKGIVLDVLGAIFILAGADLCFGIKAT